MFTYDDRSVFSGLFSNFGIQILECKTNDTAYTSEHCQTFIEQNSDLKLNDYTTITAV